MHGNGKLTIQMAPGAIAVSHTASKTWISDQTKERDAIARLRENCVRIAPRSPFVPASWQGWLKHRLWTKEEAHKKECERLRTKEMQTVNRQQVDLPLDGKMFDDFRSPVLARESIWLPHSNPVPGRPQALWPTNDELKYEGSYRNMSGYNRFHPLPRVPGNETAHWRQRAPLAQLPFDQVGFQNLSQETTADVDEQMISLVGEDLLDALDE